MTEILHKLVTDLKTRWERSVERQHLGCDRLVQRKESLYKMIPADQ